MTGWQGASFREIYMHMYVGHDERSGSEPDIRPTNLTGSPYASYRMVGVTGKPKI